MKPYCDLMGVSMTPYSSLASGRLSRHPGETSKRLKKMFMLKENMMKEKKKILLSFKELKNLPKKEIVQCQKFL